MSTWEPVEVSSQPWICPYQDLLWRICSYGYAPSHCGYAPARTSYDGYAPMDMPLPTVDMLRPGYAPMDMLLLNCGYASTRISHGGYAPMDMLLPPMGMSLPGSPLVDKLLWTCSSQLQWCSCQNLLLWVWRVDMTSQNVNSIRMSCRDHTRTGFLILWGKTWITIFFIPQVNIFILWAARVNIGNL